MGTKSQHNYLGLVLSSLEDNLDEFVSDPIIHSASRDNSKLADIVGRARVLRNLVETTAQEMVPDWRED